MAEKKSAKEERDDLFHLRHGFRPDGEQKGVTILGGKMPKINPDEKGVEIIDPRHGRQS